MPGGSGLSPETSRRPAFGPVCAAPACSSAAAAQTEEASDQRSGEGGKLMDRHGRPPASDVEAWLAQELSFLYAVERKILRRAALARRSRWLCAALLAAGVCCSVWALVGTMGKS